MARRLLAAGNPDRSQLTINTTQTPMSRADEHRRNVEDRRARHRSPAYLERIKKLDASAALDHSQIHQFIDEIREEFGQVGLLERPLGLVAECFLGPPFRVHLLDLSGTIVEHFEVGRSMPTPFESARSLALHPDYQFVEVYPSQLVAIDQNGAASPVPLQAP